MTPKVVFEDLFEQLRIRFVRAGWILAALCTVFTAAWIANMLLLGPDRPGYEVFADAPILFRLNFAAAFFVDFFHIPLAVALCVVVAARAPARALMGTVFYVLALPLNLACYFLNGAVLPRIYGGAEPVPGGTEQSAIAAIVDMGSRLSLLAGMDFLGYGVMGVGAALLGSALWGKGWLWSAGAVLGVATGVLSALGAAGLYVDSKELAFLCVAGGFVAAVFTAVLIPAFLTEAKELKRTSGRFAP